MLHAKNGEIWQAKAALDEIMKEPWPVKTAYGLAKLARRVGEAVQSIDRVRVGLVTQYGSPQENGQVGIMPGHDNWEQFVTAYNELMNEEDAIECARVVLPDVSIEVKPSVLMALDPFIEMVDEHSRTAPPLTLVQ